MIYPKSWCLNQGFYWVLGRSLLCAPGQWWSPYLRSGYLRDTFAWREARKKVESPGWDAMARDLGKEVHTWEVLSGLYLSKKQNHSTFGCLKTARNFWKFCFFNLRVWTTEGNLCSCCLSLVICSLLLAFLKFGQGSSLIGQGNGDFFLLILLLVLFMLLVFAIVLFLLMMLLLIVSHWVCMITWHVCGDDILNSFDTVAFCEPGECEGMFCFTS